MLSDMQTIYDKAIKNARTRPNWFYKPLLQYKPKALHKLLTDQGYKHGSVRTCLTTNQHNRKLLSVQGPCIRKLAQASNRKAEVAYK